MRPVGAHTSRQKTVGTRPRTVYNRLSCEIIFSMHKLLVLLVLAMPLAASGGQGNPQSVAARAEYSVGKLAFDKCRGGCDIFVMASPNSKPKRLVAGQNPAWSPDGEKIVYCKGEGLSGFGQIHLINADGSGHKQLTMLEGGAYGPDWSPDGNAIAFTASGRILVMDKNGQSVRKIIGGYGARWSPDGKQLVFLQYSARHGSICIVNADGTGARRVIEDNSSVLEATWIPDGKSIAFCPEREHKHKSAIFRVNIDGTGLEAVAVDERRSLFFPRLSPDGQRLVGDGFVKGSGEGDVLLLDLASHQASVLAHGLHPSVVWEKR